VADSGGIDLGHDQRHVLVHAPERGVVDDDGASFGGARRELGRDLGARRGQDDIDALEVEPLEASAFSVWSPNATSMPMDRDDATA